MLHIPDLTIKLYGFLPFYLIYGSYFPYDRQIGSCSFKSNKNDKEFEYNLLINRYLKFCTNYEKNIYVFSLNFA